MFINKLYKPQYNLQIKHVPKYKSLIIFCCFIFAILIAFFAGLFINKMSYKNWQELRVAHKSTLDKLDYIQLNYATLQSDFKIEADSVKVLKTTLVEKDQLINNLHKKLLFYKRVVSPTSKDAVIVAGLSIDKQKQDDLYNLQIYLKQQRKNKQNIKGKLKFDIIGEKEGQRKLYNINQLTIDSQKNLQYQLKNFQKIVTTVKLPKKFKPHSIVIYLKDGINSRVYKKKFFWKTEKGEYNNVG